MEEGLHIEIQEVDRYVVVQVAGAFSLENGKKLIDILESESKKRGHDLFLVDALRTGPPAQDMDRFYLGEYAAIKWRRGLKVAAVYPQKLINKFFENVAVNRGANVIVVGDRNQALKWLLGHLPNKPDAGDAQQRT
jgi:hypothetical protein